LEHTGPDDNPTSKAVKVINRCLDQDIHEETGLCANIAVVEVNNEKDSVPLEDVDAGTVGYECHPEDQVRTEGSEDASECQGEEAEANSQGEKDSDTDDDGDAETDQGGEESDASTVAAKKIYLPFISTALLEAVPDGMKKAHLAGAHSCHRSAMRAAILLAEKLGFIDLHAVDSAREKVCPDTKLRRCLHLFSHYQSENLASFEDLVLARFREILLGHGEEVYHNDDSLAN
jgi:hypothetical protein